MKSPMAELLPLSTFGILLTLLAYVAALWLYRRSASSAFLPPALSGVTLIMLVLWLADIPYETYLESASVTHALLGTAPAALAIPLHQHSQKIRENWPPLLVTLLFSGT